MSALTDEVSWRRPADVVWCEGADGEAYVVTPGGAQIRVLSDNASLIWQCADAGTTEQVVLRVAERTQLDPAAIRADVASCLEQLAELNLLDGIGEPSK